MQLSPDLPALGPDPTLPCTDHAQGRGTGGGRRCSGKEEEVREDGERVRVRERETKCWLIICVAVVPGGWSASRELTVLFGCPNFTAEGSDVRTGG